jgi:hypothetical protein
MLRATKWGMMAALALLAAPGVSGQCLPIVCSLTLTLQSDASGMTLGGSGTSSATLSFGSMQAFGGALPSGATKSVGTTNWTISTPFDVKVTCSNLLTLLPCTLLLTPTYILTAELQTANAIDTWKIGGVTLNSTSASTLTSNGTYGAVTAYTFALTIPFSESSGTISNQINLLSVCN